MTLKYQNYETSHFLHFLMTLLTGGIWIIVWILVAINNWDRRRLLENEIEKEIDSGKTT